MELAKKIVLEIASTSRRVTGAATEYAFRKGFKNVLACHFRLEKEMRKMSVAAEGISKVLDWCSLPNGPPLDDRLEEWFSSEELPACLETLSQMENMLKMFDLANTFQSSSATPSEDKITAAVKLFDSRRNYFHFLLTTDVWNCEEPRQGRPRARPVHFQEATEKMSLPNVNIMEASPDGLIVPPGKLDCPRAVTEEDESRKLSNLNKIDRILQWLGGLSCTTKQKEMLSTRQADTCVWLNSTPEYKSWIDNDNSFLWLQGKPGCGKTVLASFVIDSLKTKLEGGKILAFFYCDFRNDRSMNASEVMRSLLSQLLHHIRNEDPVNMDPGLVDSLIMEKDGDTPIRDDVEQLANFVSRVAKCFTHQPRVVVDALDECKDVEKLLESLLILTKGGVRLFVTSRPLEIIKYGLRGLPFISMDKMIAVVSTDIALHVTRELDSRRRLRDLSLELKTEIHSVLCDKADGMFRWVQCQICTLNQCTTKAEVREALDNLPAGLDETYQRILLAIDTESPMGKLALRALVWLVGALRPLRLLEIYEALTLDLAKRTMNTDIRPIHKSVLLEACSSLVTYDEDTDVLILSHFSVKEYLTGNLVRIKLPRHHFSLQGAHEHLARFCICYVTVCLKNLDGAGDGNGTPSSCTLRTISGPSFKHIRQRSHFLNNASAALPMPQDLLGYVFTKGFNHLAHLGSANRVVLKDILILQSDVQQHPAAWTEICRMSQDYKLPVPWPDRQHDFMLYILTTFASDSLLREHLGSHRNAIQPKDRTNPLVYAAHFGKVQQAQTLLLHNAKVNEKGLVMDTSHLASPLQVAVSRQHDAMVDLLLSAGSVVPKVLFERSTGRNFPIRILRRLFETEEFVEWAVEPGNRLLSPVELLERRPPLIYESDIIVMIRRLIQVGVDPVAHNAARKTALYFAIEGGYHAITLYLLLLGIPLPSDFTPTMRITQAENIHLIRLIVEATLPPPNTLFSILRSALPMNWRAQTICSLVRKGVDTRGLLSDGDTLFHTAVLCLDQNRGLLDVAELLIDAGCGPFERNARGMTPFRLALDRKLRLLADLIISTETLPPPDDLFSIVHSALPSDWRGRTICSLIQKGVQVHEKSANGDTLMHATVLYLDQSQALDVVELLINAGCDPFERNARGMTPLRLALGRKFCLLADLIISTETFSPSDDLSFILHSALVPSDWRIHTICSFIRKGIQVHEKSADGDTLLHTGESQGLDVVKLLINAGCDFSARDEQGNTVLHDILEMNGSTSIVDYILSSGQLPPDDILFHVLDVSPWRRLNLPMLQMLVAKGANVHATIDGNNILHSAIPRYYNSDNELKLVLQILIDGGCDPLLPDSRGKTPLHLAVTERSVVAVAYLLSVPALVPPPADILAVALEMISVSTLNIISLLIRKGADVRFRTADGNTLLHLAIKNALDRHLPLLPPIVTTLVDSGCDPSECNADGHPAVHFA